MNCVPAQIEFSQRARAARQRIAAAAVPVPLPPPPVKITFALPPIVEKPPEAEPVPPPASVWKPLLFVMAEYLAQGKKPPKDVVVTVCAGITEMPVKYLTGLARNPKIVAARQFSVWCFITSRKDSLKGTGNSFGKRDHSTIVHARDKAAKWIAERSLPDLWQRFADHIIAGTLDDLAAEINSIELEFTP